MSEETKVTWWHPTKGYHRERPSSEFQAFLDDGTGGYTNVLHALGYENIDGTDDEKSCLSVTVYQHNSTRELMLDMANLNQGLACVHVHGDHADAFMFTEYLRIVQQINTANEGEDLHLIRKAFYAFIRHGHGKLTISEFGQTLDERNSEIEARRARDEHKRKTA